MKRRRQRGFSLTELITVVAMIGVIALIATPALMQLMPQYRIRSAASDAAASMRLVRQKAVSTRRPWRVQFDEPNNQYAFAMLNAPNANMAVAANWTRMGRDARPLPMSGTGSWWIRTSAVDLRTATSNAFKDVDCDGYKEVIFLRNGSVADEPNGGTCGAGADLAFTTAPSVVFAVENRWVKFNRYYLTLQQNGRLTIVPARE